MDRHTFNASFFSLFIALNCFILESTALSMGLSDASSLIHGCSKMNIQIQKFQLEKKCTQHLKKKKKTVNVKGNIFARLTKSTLTRLEELGNYIFSKRLKYVDVKSYSNRLLLLENPGL